MEFREVIEERRSIRKFYPKPIPLELIGELIAYATRAPSVGDLQPWNFIVVTKAKQIQEVADACPYERWLYQAPLVIVICALEGKAETYYPGKGHDWALQSCAAAAQNILLGAVDLGLGGCWISAFENIKIKEVLHIPDGIEPCAMLALGYPDEEAPSKRYAPFHTNTFFNDFGKPSTDIAVFKKDYGEFFRDKLDDVKTRAAYATSERGGLRAAAHNLRHGIKKFFSKKDKPGPNTRRDDANEHGANRPDRRHGPDSHTLGSGKDHDYHEPMDDEDHDHDGHDWHTH